MEQPIPRTLAPFFQEYEFERLDPQLSAALIVERVLQFGDRAEVRWLFRRYPRTQITDWIKKYARERLPNPHRTFWMTVLEIEA